MKKIGKLLRESLDAKFMKFILLGVINTLVGTAVMFALYNLESCGYWLSSAANYVVGSIVSYFLNKYFTFQNRERSLKQIGKFILNIVICYVIAYGAAKPMALWVLTGAPLAIQENVAMLVGMVLFTLLNYFGQRFFTFKEDKSETEQ